MGWAMCLSKWHIHLTTAIHTFIHSVIRFLACPYTSLALHCMTHRRMGGHCAVVNVKFSAGPHE